jgi:hypothetical protein
MEIVAHRIKLNVLACWNGYRHLSNVLTAIQYQTFVPSGGRQ